MADIPTAVVEWIDAVFLCIYSYSVYTTAKASTTTTNANGDNLGGWTEGWD